VQIKRSNSLVPPSGVYLYPSPDRAGVGWVSDGHPDRSEESGNPPAAPWLGRGLGAGAKSKLQDPQGSGEASWTLSAKGELNPARPILPAPFQARYGAATGFGEPKGAHGLVSASLQGTAARRAQGASLPFPTRAPGGLGRISVRLINKTGKSALYLLWGEKTPAQAWKDGGSIPPLTHAGLPRPGTSITAEPPYFFPPTGILVSLSHLRRIKFHPFLPPNEGGMPFVRRTCITAALISLLPWHHCFWESPEPGAYGYHQHRPTPDCQRQTAGAEG